MRYLFIISILLLVIIIVIIISISIIIIITSVAYHSTDSFSSISKWSLDYVWRGILCVVRHVNTKACLLLPDVCFLRWILANHGRNLKIWLLCCFCSHEPEHHQG